MFIKRAQPAAPRRPLRKAPSSESDGEERVKQPASKAIRKPISSGSEGDADDDDGCINSKEALKTKAAKTRISLDVHEEGKAFRVKKTKLSRQMAATGTPVTKRSVLCNVSNSRQDGGRVVRPWKEDIGVEDPCVVDATSNKNVQGEPDTGNVVDDVEIAVGEDSESGSGPDTRAGATARIARAQRASIRERYGDIADAGGVPDHQADYIPMVGSKLGSDRKEVGIVVSPHDSEKKATSHALVTAGAFDTNDEADGADAWAIQQMRIGAHRRQGSYPVDPADMDTGFVKPSERSEVPLPPSKRLKAKFGDVGISKVQAPSVAVATLWETLQKLEGGISEREKRESELEVRRQEASDELGKVDTQVCNIEKKLKIAQELDEFAWGFGGLLDVKAPKLTQASETLAQMEQHFASKRSNRRIRDIAHDVVTQGGAVLSKPLQNEDDMTDEEEFAKAATRREARRSRRQKRVVPNNHEFHEGWATSSSSEEDCLAELASDRAAFCGAVHKQVIGDVADSFSAAASVLIPIRAAKRSLQEEYIKAFVPMSLPDVFALHIQHSLLWWDPLELCLHARNGHESKDNKSLAWGPKRPVTSIQFEGFDWFEELAAFTELLGDDDPDNELVPKLMQRCLFPEVSRRITDSWDVTSVTQSKRIVALLDECLLFETDEAATAYTGLLEATSRRLEDGLAGHAPEVFVSNEALSKWYASDARFRLLWRSCKIAKCALLFDQRLPDPQLSRIVLSDIFSTRIAPHLRCPRIYTKELELIERFVSLVPERWFEQGLPPALVPLRDSLGPRAPRTAEAARTLERAASVLSRMRCHDEAQVLLEAL